VDSYSVGLTENAKKNLVIAGGKMRRMAVIAAMKVKVTGVAARSSEGAIGLGVEGMRVAAGTTKVTATWAAVGFELEMSRNG